MGLQQPSAIRSQLLGIPRRYFALIRDLAIPSFRENRVSRIRFPATYPRIHDRRCESKFSKRNRNVIDLGGRTMQREYLRCCVYIHRGIQFGGCVTRI